MKWELHGFECDTKTDGLRSCNAQYNEPTAVAPSTMIERAERFGWKINVQSDEHLDKPGNRDYCPKCVKQLREANKAPNPAIVRGYN